MRDDGIDYILPLLGNYWVLHLGINIEGFGVTVEGSGLVGSGLSVRIIKYVFMVTWLGQTPLVVVLLNSLTATSLAPQLVWFAHYRF
jgi:hypothetical protein